MGARGGGGGGGGGGKTRGHLSGGSVSIHDVDFLRPCCREPNREISIGMQIRVVAIDAKEQVALEAMSGRGHQLSEKWMLPNGSKCGTSRNELQGTRFY